MTAALIAAIVATPVAFLLGNLYVSSLLSLPGQPIMNLTAAIAHLPGFVMGGGGLSIEPAAI